MSSVRNDPNYFRASLGLRDEITPQVKADYHSELVDWLRANGNRLAVGDVTFVLAKEFGFCYGVDKAIDMAYEARAKFPDKRIFLTYEIIHNPRVNARLEEMGIIFLSGGLHKGASVDEITKDDVVIMPAFGVPSDFLEKLRAIGCVLIDTTCGSVVHVWKRVERYAKDGYTALVHGKALHAETLATVSQASKLGGHFIIVRDKTEAQLVCDAITGKRPLEDVYTLGDLALSKGFDPSIHLQHIGVANQTTMLERESLEIAGMVGRALEEKYGKEQIDKHFRSFDTICSATQERQDAIVELVESGELDLMLVVGGYNSSNTGHLLAIADGKVPAYHICDAGELVSATEIRHKPVGQKEPVLGNDWLPQGSLKIGLTAGASTPNRALGETMARVAELRGLAMPDELRGMGKGE